jgi:pilus assembly protein CpaC
LFLMGVTQGRTTVIATSDAGDAIGQYNVIVTPGLGRAPSAPGAAPVSAAEPAFRGIGPGAAREIQLLVRRTVPGTGSFTAEVAGGRLVLRGFVPNAMAAQQVEAIARGVIGEDATIVDTMTVLGSIQVNVRVRIAEIGRTITRQLGFNWQALGAGGNWRFGVLTGAASGITSAVDRWRRAPCPPTRRRSSPWASRHFRAPRRGRSSLAPATRRGHATSTASSTRWPRISSSLSSRSPI